MGGDRSTIRVVAPATTANLGPGFDCLGAALDLRLTLELQTTETSYLNVLLDASSRDEPPRPDLIVRAVRAVAGEGFGELGLGMSTDIPIGRGLGSSAAAIAAGLLLGCALIGKEPDPAELLALGTPIEGHPDNLAAALYGGLVLVVPTGGSYEVMRFVPDASVRPCIVVPRERLETAAARRALPDAVPLADAVANVARTSGLLALLTGKIEPTSRRLVACTEDLLHQPHRLPLMPETAKAIERFRDAGIAAVVSGAGPSVLCLVPEADLPRFGEVASSLDAWQRLELAWDAAGARIDDRLV